MDKSITMPLPIGAVPPIGVLPEGPGGGGGGGAEALAMMTGTIINKLTKMMCNIDFFIRCNFISSKITLIIAVCYFVIKTFSE